MCKRRKGKAVSNILSFKENDLPLIFESKSLAETTHN